MPMHHTSDHDEPDDVDHTEELDDPEVLAVAAQILITCIALAFVAIWLMLWGT